MEAAGLIWRKVKWGLLLVLAVLVAVFGILQVTHQRASIRSATQRTTAPLAGLTPATCKLLPPETPPEFATVEFKTDFRKHCVHYDEILSGGPPKDGIPALDAPRLVTVNEADAWLKPDQPVISFQVGSYGGRVLDFGTTGRVRFSDLLMYDHQPASWWRQAIGQAIIGQLTGTTLVSMPAGILS